MTGLPQRWHGILFRDEMIRALRRTDPPPKDVTRRVIPADPKKDRWARVSPGDGLWTKEVYAESPGGVEYRADRDDLAARPRHVPKWRSSMFQPARLARGLYEVVSIVVDPDPLTLDDVEAKREGFNDAGHFRRLFAAMHPAGSMPRGVWRIELKPLRPFEEARSALLAAVEG